MGDKHGFDQDLRNDDKVFNYLDFATFWNSISFKIHMSSQWTFWT